MRLFTRNGFIFTGILALLLVTLDFLLLEGQKNYPSLAGIKLKKVIEEKSLNSEIVIFGSSVAEGGIDPATLSAVTGMSCVNLALSGRRIQDWQPLAYNYLDYADSTKIVIIDIFPNAFNFPHSIYHPHDYYPYLANPYVKKSLAAINPELAKMSRIPFFYLTQLNSTMVLNAAGYWGNFLSNKTYSYQLEDNGFNKKHQQSVSQDFKPLPIELNSTSIDAFHKLLSYCQTRRVTVILVGMPVLMEGRKYYTGIDQVYKKAKGLAETYQNVFFINYITNPYYNSERLYFDNYTHLNNRGARIISTDLASYLISTERSDVN